MQFFFLQIYLYTINHPKLSLHHTFFPSSQAWTRVLSQSKWSGGGGEDGGGVGDGGDDVDGACGEGGAGGECGAGDGGVGVGVGGVGGVGGEGPSTKKPSF